MIKKLIVTVSLSVIGLFGVYLLKEQVSGQACYTRIPMSFLKEVTVPIINVQIENQEYPLMIDLGAKGHIYLKEDILKNLKKTPLMKQVTWYDVKGTMHASKEYLVPNIKIGRKIYREVFIREEAPNWIAEGSVIQDPLGSVSAERQQKTEGIAGIDLFENGCCLFDFQGHVMYITENINNLQKEGYYLRDMVEIPSEFKKQGIFVPIETDLGVKKFLIDTGSSHCFIHSPEVERILLRNGIGVLCSKMRRYKTLKFVMGSLDLGQRDLYFYKLPRKTSPPYVERIEAVLGMDFLQHILLAIDFVNSKVYMGASPYRIKHARGKITT